jgi:hypothetical protein
MARGFESKFVESQQADREASAAASSVKPNAEDAARLARRRTLELARTRALGDLSTACRPGHRGMLEAAIEALELQIRDLDRH